MGRLFWYILKAGPTAFDARCHVETGGREETQGDSKAAASAPGRMVVLFQSPGLPEEGPVWEGGFGSGSVSQSKLLWVHIGQDDPQTTPAKTRTRSRTRRHCSVQVLCKQQRKQLKGCAEVPLD